MSEPTHDPHTCPHCGTSTWNLRLAPDEAVLSVTPRTVVAIWCADCGTPAPPAHPFWPTPRDAAAHEGAPRWTR